MDSLFERWGMQTAKFSKVFRSSLFDVYCRKSGGSETHREAMGKPFANFYELYIYAFFVGLYSNNPVPIPIEEKEDSFNYEIHNWGKIGSRKGREDYSRIQSYIYIALLDKAEIDFIELDKGKFQIQDAVNVLMNLMKEYTNGGLLLIKQKIDDDPDFFASPIKFRSFIHDLSK